MTSHPRCKGVKQNCLENAFSTLVMYNPPTIPFHAIPHPFLHHPTPHSYIHNFLPYPHNPNLACTTSKSAKQQPQKELQRPSRILVRFLLVSSARPLVCSCFFMAASPV